MLGQVLDHLEAHKLGRSAASPLRVKLRFFCNTILTRLTMSFVLALLLSAYPFVQNDKSMDVMQIVCQTVVYVFSP